MQYKAVGFKVLDDNCAAPFKYPLDSSMAYTSLQGAQVMYDHQMRVVAFFKISVSKQANPEGLYFQCFPDRYEIWLDTRLGRRWQKNRKYVCKMLEPSSKQFFGSIVVSISACHSKEQLAGGRGSIPRQRDTFIFGNFAFCGSGRGGGSDRRDGVGNA
jgi:hypothetical protein